VATKYQREHGRTRKPKALVEQAGKLHIEGKPNREISRTLGVHQAIVPSLLAQSEVVERFRMRLLGQVPRLLRNFKLLTTPGTPDLSTEELGRNTRWGLEAAQVAVKREVREHEVYDPLDALSDEEFARLEQQVDRIIERGRVASTTRRQKSSTRKARKNPEG
jgi:hypothetical protein